MKSVTTFTGNVNKFVTACLEIIVFINSHNKIVSYLVKVPH